MSRSDRLDVYLVAGGKYHNIDYARLELLKLMAEQPRLKVQVGADYGDIDAICAADRIEGVVTIRFERAAAMKRNVDARRLRGHLRVRRAQQRMRVQALHQVVARRQ